MSSDITTTTSIVNISANNHPISDPITEGCMRSKESVYLIPKSDHNSNSSSSNNSNSSNNNSRNRSLMLEVLLESSMCKIKMGSVIYGEDRLRILLYILCNYEKRKGRSVYIRNFEQDTDLLVNLPKSSYKAKDLVKLRSHTLNLTLILIANILTLHSTMRHVKL